MGDLLIEYRDKVTRNKKGQREETYRINRILKTPIAQKMISDITVKDINDCIEVRLRSPSVGGRGGFYINARVKIGHWRHQMHTILAHSYPSVTS